MKNIKDDNNDINFLREQLKNIEYYKLGYNAALKKFQISDEVLFEQSTVAMEAHYGYGCETEIDAYFRGAKWMQEQFNKQDNI